jgi:hypothetical protein
VKRVLEDASSEVLGLEKETAEAIFAGEENQQHRGQPSSVANIRRRPWEVVPAACRGDGRFLIGP